MARRVSNNHYIATHGAPDGFMIRNGHSNIAYSTDGEDSHRAASEYMVSHERGMSPGPRKARSSSHQHLNHHHSSQQALTVPSTHRHSSHATLVPSGGPPARPPPRAPSQFSFGDTGSDVYVTSAAYKAPSEISRGSRYSQPARSVYSYRSGAAPSVASTRRTRRSAGMKAEAMVAPNPFCPNVKGMCCLLLLLNLGLILVTLGFVIVIQFFKPLFVWILGIVFLIFGFLTLIGSMIYCVVVCRDTRHPRDMNPEELYWTHHWQKSIGHTPSAHGYSKHNGLDDRDGYGSDRYSTAKYSDRDSTRY